MKALGITPETLRAILSIHLYYFPNCRICSGGVKTASAIFDVSVHFSVHCQANCIFTLLLNFYLHCFTFSSLTIKHTMCTQVLITLERGSKILYKVIKIRCFFDAKYACTVDQIQICPHIKTNVSFFSFLSSHTNGGRNNSRWAEQS